MWNRFRFYTALAIRDLQRLRSATLLQTLILAGVTFPILVLTALKRGHVEELRRELVTSPTGREIRLYSSSEGDFFRLDQLDALRQRLGAVDLVIPVTERRTCRLTVPNSRHGVPATVEGVDLLATRPGDPTLAAVGADRVRAGERGIVLSAELAERLGVLPGDSAQLIVERSLGGDERTADFPVLAITPKAGGSDIAYVDAHVLEKLIVFSRGGGVPEWRWPAADAPPKPVHAAMISVCETIDPFQELDHRRLADHGLRAERMDNLADCHLDQIFDVEKRKMLEFHRITKADRAESLKSVITLRPDEVERITPAGDVAIPWNDPRQVRIAEKPFWMIGLSLDSPWVRNHLRHPDLPFKLNEVSHRLRFVDLDWEPPSVVELALIDSVRLSLVAQTVSGRQGGTSDPAEVIAEAEIPGSNGLPLVARPLPETDPLSLPLAVVPASLLSSVESVRQGHALLDTVSQKFVPRPDVPTYEKVRIYARTIDDVLDVVDRAETLRYGCIAENARIAEIRSQDQSLQSLVRIVALAVFSFGLVTTFAVLLESTDRKRNMLGVLRVMGASPRGMFYFVVLRAAALGLSGALLTTLLSFAAVSFLKWSPALENPGYSWLSWKPVSSAVIGPSDIGLVFAGSLVCCALGAVYPAWKASRLDPIHSVVEGRFR